MRDMKKTSCQWVGSIPMNWTVERIKYLIEAGDDGMKIGPFGSALRGKTMADGPVKIYNQANLIADDFDLSRHYISAESYEELKSYTIKPGDILFSMMGTIGKCKVMPEGKPLGIMDSHLLKARLGKKVLPEFFIYAFDKDNNGMTLEQLIYMSQGSIMNGLNSGVVKNAVLAVPPLEEQRAIVRYLDSKCAAIDEAIERHKKIIEKLEEYRTKVVSHVVIHGLRKDVEEKSYLVIGKCPVHWKVSRLKFSANIVRGGSPRPIDDYITDKDGFNWIKISDATGNGKYINSTKQQIIPEGLSKTRLVHSGTLLLTNSMSFGHPYILNIDGCIHDGWLAFSDYEGIEQDYLYYYLMSDSAMNQFVRTVEGSVVNNLNIEKVKNSLIAIPPTDEQKTIVAYLDKQNMIIDNAIKSKQEIVEKLEEYRKSIIYNAVTGKIDCRTEV